jgi:diguanylate cyclase (GGDEF)-like protein
MGWNLWGKSKSSEPPSEPQIVTRSEAPSDGVDDASEKAMDTLGDLLRTYGKYAFDLEDKEATQIADTFERWARHLLVRAPRPGTEAEERSSSAPVRRDWVGMKQYFTGLRKEEHGYVTKALADMRQVIWAFLHSLNHAMSDDTEADGRVKQQLEKLRTAADTPNLEELKREVFSVVSTISEVIEERKLRQKTQVADLAKKLRAVNRQLEDARREGALDALTKLHNRKSFDDYIVQTADLNGLFGREACLVMLDIDHFKVVNDTYGHPAGDEVLRQVSNCLAKTFLRKTDMTARYGGEEFAVVLGETNLKDAILLTDRLLNSIRNLKIDVGGRLITVTASAGVSEVLANESAPNWINRTDQALYQAKKDGRDRQIQAAAPPSH